MDLLLIYQKYNEIDRFIVSNYISLGNRTHLLIQLLFPLIFLYFLFDKIMIKNFADFQFYENLEFLETIFCNSDHQ